MIFRWKICRWLAVNFENHLHSCGVNSDLGECFFWVRASRWLHQLTAHHKRCLLFWKWMQMVACACVDLCEIDTKLVEDKYKTGTGEVLRPGQKSRLKQRQTSHMVLLAAQHWLVGSDKYRLQHSQMNIIACSCHDGERGRKVVSLWQSGQTLRVRFQVSGYSWIRLVEYQWVFRSRIVITRAVIRVNCVILLSRCVNCHQLRNSVRLRVTAPCSRRNWAIKAPSSHVVITRGVLPIRSATSHCQDGSTSIMMTPSSRWNGTIEHFLRCSMASGPRWYWLLFLVGFSPLLLTVDQFPR